MKRITVSILAFSAMFIVSCSKKSDQEFSSSPTKSNSELIQKLRTINSEFSSRTRQAHSTAKATVSVSNSANPFDNYGYWHNQGLSYLEASLDSITDDSKTISFTENGTPYTYTSFADKAIAMTARFGYDNRVAVSASLSQSSPANYFALYNHIANGYVSDMRDVINIALDADSTTYYTDVIDKIPGITADERTIDSLLICSYGRLV